MLFWLILGTAFMVAGLRVRDTNWWYSREISGILFPASFASFMMPGWGLLQFEDPGFQGLGLILIVCSWWMWIAAILIAVGTLIECIIDWVQDIREK